MVEGCGTAAIISAIDADVPLCVLGRDSMWTKQFSRAPGSVPCMGTSKRQALEGPLESLATFSSTGP